MCEFFSCISDGNGNIKYFDAKQRNKIGRNRLYDRNLSVVTNTDSHSSITAFYGVNDDQCNKWEYNPITKTLRADTIRVRNDANQVHKILNNLDFRTIVPEFVPRTLVNPRKVKRTLKTVSKKEIELLKKWLRTRGKLRGGCDADTPIWNMIEAQDRLGSPLSSLVRQATENLGTPFGWTLRNQLRGSFIRTKESHGKTGKYKFQAAVDLMEAGLLPFYEGNSVRLIRAKDGKVVFTSTKAKLRKRK